MVESSTLPEGTIRAPPQLVRDFTAAAFTSAGVAEADALLIADVLVRADLRGVRSHGVARLGYFLNRLENGVLNTSPSMTFTRRTSTTGTLDADDAVGIVAARKAMERAIGMAGDHGSGFVTVTNSSHFGYAGYWAEMAMRQGLIGIAMSNSGRRATPTFAREALLGTNPLSVAIPGGADGTDFHLDMATSAVAVGKVETALRERRPVPDGWVAGEPVLDEHGILSFDAPLLPLGGDGDVTGGHKGYGLGLMVELLCGALAGSPLSARLAGAGGAAAAAMGHFMGAIEVSGFRDEGEVAADMQTTFDVLRAATKAPGRDRVYIHGEPETEAAEENERLGVPITPALRDEMRRWNDRLGLGFSW